MELLVNGSRRRVDADLSRAFSVRSRHRFRRAGQVEAWPFTALQEE
jgi:hypothetical protein